MNPLPRLISAAALVLAAGLEPALPAELNLLKNGGFEEGLASPWGTGLYGGQAAIWGNSGGCLSQADVSAQVYRSGKASLHIVNSSPRAPNVFGTAAQRIAIQPSQKYKITLWARGRELGSQGAVGIIVDAAWKIRPLVLPSGSFEWRRFEGTFDLPTSIADIRILSEDKGEVWLDDISVTPVPAGNPVPLFGVHSVAVKPEVVPRGGEARIAVDYDSSAPGKPVPVVEEWTLLFKDEPVMPTLKTEFEVRAGRSRHEFTLPIPTEAGLGKYRMGLRVTAAGQEVRAQASFDVK